MSEYIKQIGLYDTETQRLVWRASRIPINLVSPSVIEGGPRGNLVLVWVFFDMENSLSLRCSLYRILTGEVIDENYDIRKTILPGRWKVTPFGESYLWVFGLNYHAGDTITESILKLKMEYPDEVHSDRDWLYYGSRKVAHWVGR